MSSPDPRIPVIFLADPAALAAALSAPGARPAAVLEEAPPGGPEAGRTAPRVAGRAAAAGPGGPAPARAAFSPAAARHAIGCACCAGRSPAAQALDRLFQQRARGQCAWFDHVLALAPSPAGAAMLAAALAEDVLTRARFRVEG